MICYCLFNTLFHLIWLETVGSGTGINSEDDVRSKISVCWIAWEPASHAGQKQVSQWIITWITDLCSLSLFQTQSPRMSMINKNKWPFTPVRTRSKGDTHPWLLGLHTWTVIMWRSVAVPQEHGDWSTSKSSSATLGHPPRGRPTLPESDTCLPIFMVAPLHSQKSWRIYTLKYYSAIKKKKWDHRFAG